MALKIKDVAQRLKVSPATVSLVLNNKPGVAEETRQRVLKLVQEMGYDTNILSKPALKNSKSIRFIIYKKHGSVVSDTPFFSALMEGIEQECRKEGYNLVVSYMNEDGNRMEVLRIVEDNPLEGILLLATEMQEEDLQTFTQFNIPIVILDSCFEKLKIDTVFIENIQGAFEATEYLVKNGHTEIGYLHSSIWIKNFDKRKEGFQKALKEYNIQENKKYIFSVDSTLEGSYNDILKLLNSNISLPTAFFADNDIIAFGAIKAFKEFGLRVPEDVSVVGFDDMPFCEIIEPPLTTIKVNKQRMGMLAVKRLLEKIETDSPECVRLEVCTELVERKSVICKGDQRV